MFMHHITLLAVASVALVGCQQQEANEKPTAAPSDTADAAPSVAGAAKAEPRWETVGGSEGAHARLLTGDGTLVMSIGCRMGSGQLEVVVPGFRRVGSEDRLSVGFDDDPIALAVDMQASGDGVRASGTVTEDIGSRIVSAKTVGVSYGNQNLGPYAPPAGPDAQSLAIACVSPVAATKQ
jgi:hypothetical protein